MVGSEHYSFQWFTPPLWKVVSAFVILLIEPKNKLQNWSFVKVYYRIWFYFTQHQSSSLNCWQANAFVKKLLCNDSVEHHKIRKCTMNCLSKNCLKWVIGDLIRRNCKSFYLLEWFPCACHIPKSSDIPKSSVCHDNHKNSLHFHWQQIPITSAQFIIKQIELISYRFAEFTTEKQQKQSPAHHKRRNHYSRRIWIRVLLWRMQKYWTIIRANMRCKSHWNRNYSTNSVWMMSMAMQMRSKLHTNSTSITNSMMVFKSSINLNGMNNI